MNICYLLLVVLVILICEEFDFCFVGFVPFIFLIENVITLNV